MIYRHTCDPTFLINEMSKENASTFRNDRNGMVFPRIKSQGDEYSANNGGDILELSSNKLCFNRISFLELITVTSENGNL